MQGQDEIHRGGEGFVWHPAIRALGWAKDWAIWSILAAVIWQWIDGTLRTPSAASVLARAVVVCSVLAASIVPLEVVHQWLRSCREARRRAGSDASYARWAIAVVSTIALLCSGLYGLVAWWIGSRIWPQLWTLGSRLGPDWAAPMLTSTLVVPRWMAIPTLAVAAYLTFQTVRPLPAGHARAVRTLGRRRASRGYLLMAILRLRQPRKDFFFQAPLVRDVPLFAIAAALHTFVAPRFLALALAAFAIIASLALTLDHLRPPTWLFLGRSDSDSYRTFDLLRERWRVFGVTFLSRESAAWSGHYFAASHRMARSGHFLARFMNRPGTPRVWSLRSRGRLWESSVAILMELTSVIVVDARAKSYWIFDEVLWLAELGWIEKGWLLATPEGAAPALEGALAWAEKDQVVLPVGSARRLADRVVTEGQLLAARWSDEGLEMPR